MHNHEPEDYSCPFCALVRGMDDGYYNSTTSDIIHQDESITAFVGSLQREKNVGNVLIIPNQHFENIYDLPEELAIQLHKATRLMAIVLKDIYSCDGTSIRQHNEPAGGQEIWHYHIHVTPRYKGDEFYTYYKSRRAFMPPEERTGHALRLRERLNKICDPWNTKP